MTATEHRAREREAIEKARRETYDEMSQIIDTAERERRRLTTRERQQYDDLERELNKFTFELDRIDNPPVGEPISIRMALGDRRRLAGEIPILGREERFADLVPAEERAKELSLGRYVRGVLTGNWQGAAEERAMAESAGGTGGYLVPAPLSATVIDRMRNATRVIQAGAVMVPMDSATLDMARVASDPSGSWVAENAAVTESAVTLERVTFGAKTLAVLVRASRQLIEDGGPLFQDTVTNSIAQALAVELDRVSLYGSGTGAEPKGLMNAAGLQTISMGANGAQLTDYSKLIAAIQQVWQANEQPTGYILAPRTAATLAGFKDSTGQPLRAPQVVADLPQYVTNQVPVNRTQGTATNASDLILGDFSDIMIGMRHQIGIELLRERYADNLQIGFLAWARIDVQLQHVESFAPIVGIIP